MSKKSILFAGLLAGLCLVACNSAEGQQASVTSSENPSASVEDTTITNDDLSRGVTTYQTTNGETKNLTRSRIYASSGAPHVDSHPDSGIKQKLLVAPISFKSDSSDPKWIEPTDALLTKINKTFTASDEELATLSGSSITSVQSFYNQSSFGKGAFDVVVLPCWVEYEGTAKEFESSTSQAGVGMSSYVRSWYLAEYAKEGHGALGADWNYEWSEFDTDKDGYVDLLWQVYAYPYSNNSTSFWWAYVTYTGNQPNKSTPEVMTLAWASTSFMADFNGYDPHTFIHETGHTLGVNDFYDYNNTWKPMGSIDYMDQNLGDHGAYTKFMYGWINPWVVREEDLSGGKTAEITLRAQTKSGDALVLASPDYNGTAFDEYLMLELVGPYGLAERDYKAGYSNTSGYTIPGIRITHVDARMYQNNHDVPVTDPNQLGNKGGDERVSNTYGGRMSVKIDSDFWPEDGGSAPASITSKNPGAKVGGPRKLPSGNNAYYCETSLMESTVQDQNWTNNANYTASSKTTLFKKGNRFNLSPNSAWANAFMPSGTNLWNKAKTTVGWKDNNTQYYTVDETKTCNYSVRVRDIVEDAEYGAIATLSVSLLD